MSDTVDIVQIGDWVVRQKIPGNPGSTRLMLLLHGWTGDENSMWIFTPRIPDHYMILAPRGISSTPLGGYGWENAGTTGWPKAGDFQDAVQGLFDLVDLVVSPGLDTGQIDVMGFSQGAALAYTMLLNYPNRIGKLAGLSGFLPDGLNDEIAMHRLKGKKIFVSHGTRDDMVSLDYARSAVRDLKSAGSDVIYCEEDVGHKLSVGCFRAMDAYFDDSKKTP
jgi:phospholipase/carboxylesterase